MKIFIICSKHFYDKIPEIQKTLEKNGHIITLPNCYDDPKTEERFRKLGRIEHSKWKSDMIDHSMNVIKSNDAVLVLNFEKNGIKNYIGGATFLEMYDAYKLNKKIYIYNDIPEEMIRDEIVGFNPTLLNGDLSKVK